MSSGQARIYKEQYGPASEQREVFASGGRLLGEAGASMIWRGPAVFAGGLDLTSAQVTLPGVLAEGVIDLPLFNALEVSSADSLNALTSGTNPARARINAGTDPKARIVWSSGAGGADPIQWDVHLPSDVATAAPIRLNLYGEASSGAVNGWTVDARFGVGDANAFTGTTAALTSTPANTSFSIASGDIIPNVPLAVIAAPVSSTGTVSLYGARLVYSRRTS